MLKSTRNRIIPMKEKIALTIFIPRLPFIIQRENCLDAEIERAPEIIKERPPQNGYPLTKVAEAKPQTFGKATFIKPKIIPKPMCISPTTIWIAPRVFASSLKSVVAVPMAGIIICTFP